MLLFSIMPQPVKNVHADSNISAVYFRAYGDSISAGYRLDDYVNYVGSDTVPKTHDITIGCYPEIMSRQFIQNFSGEIVSYAKSGDKTGDLVLKLQPYIDQTATDYQEFYNTDVFTLCIGANNILGFAMDNIQNYIMGSISDEQYRALLSQGLEDFRNDYISKILPCFENNTKHTSKIFVMTVYNPYKYVSLNDIKINTGNPTQDLLLKSMVSGVDKSFQTMLSTTMEYVAEINDIIKKNTSNKVHCVDIASLFDSLEQTEFSKCINADASQIEITDGDLSKINSSLFSEYCDPHPSAYGQEVIANEHIKHFAMAEVEILTSLENIESDQNVDFQITSTGGENVSYKVYKNIQNNIFLLKQTNDLSFTISAQSLAGEGTVFVEVYNNSKLIYTSKGVSYSCNLLVVQNPTEGEGGEDIEQPPVARQDNLHIVTFVVMGFVALCGIIVLTKVIIISIKK